MTRQEIENQVVEVLATILRSELTSVATRADTPQWDSLKHIEFMFALEEAFGVQFTEHELSSLDSVAAVADAVQAHRAA